MGAEVVGYGGGGVRDAEAGGGGVVAPGFGGDCAACEEDRFTWGRVAVRASVIRVSVVCFV